jgi:hypothetical protein
MIHGDSFVSASGLRPLSAFVVIAAVVFCVAGKIAWVAAHPASDAPFPVCEEDGLVPTFDLVDARGRTLAHSVEHASLHVWPRSAWQAHTPDHMARVVSEALGGEPSADELLARMLPGARGGAIAVDWDLSPTEAQAVREWVASGADRRGGPLAGVTVHPTAAGWRMVWRPAQLLSAAERERHGFGKNPFSWTGHLARTLAERVPARLTALVEGLPAGTDAPPEPATLLWTSLFPVGWSRVVEDVPPARLPELARRLRAESVHAFQMCVEVRHERMHPAGDLRILGRWGFPTPEHRQPVPVDGLELLASRLLEREEWSALEGLPARYAWLRTRSTRGPDGARFQAYVPATEPVGVHTTLDLGLQRVLGEQLDGVMERHDPAVAMGIAIDVASGEVLALGSREAYPLAPLAPLYWTFEPGSTFKVVTMALALERGLVRPDTPIDVGNGAYRVPGTYRVIHEARGAPTGVISAARALAFSVNAGLVQIGLQVPAEEFRASMLELGYGARPGVGLGAEQPGMVAAPRQWTPPNAHASACFGREVSTTLWQHATALATIVRGGEWRPLTLLSGVEALGRMHPPRPREGRRVFSQRTCDEVREMMRLGAREGTGRRIFREDLDMGTKTATTHKNEDILCVHVEEAQRAALQEQGAELPADRKERRALRNAWKRLPKPHRNCYTSSMCVWGSVPGTESEGGGREVLVLVVVDEPRKNGKFGSDVAGTAAAAILAEALGLTRDGVEPVPDELPGFAGTELASGNDLALPWRGDEAYAPEDATW